MNMQWNTDGKVYVFYTTSGYQETFDWYTGGAPSGPTNFQLDVVSRNGGSSIIWSHNVGTYNYTNNFTIAITMTGTYQARTGEMYCTVTITRQGVSRSHSFYLEVIAGGI